MPRELPRPGHPIRRSEVYCWSTWLAQLLGGSVCEWRVWFLSHYQHDKRPEEEAEKLVEWNRQHNAMMAARTIELQEMGWTVRREQEFKVKGQRVPATLAGKMDLVAIEPPGGRNRLLIVDGKTGKPRQSDVWQVRLYMFAAALVYPPARGRLVVGELQYKGSDDYVTVILEAEHVDAIKEAIARIAADDPLPRVPDAFGCKRCNVREEDCADRYAGQIPAVSTEAF